MSPSITQASDLYTRVLELAVNLIERPSVTPEDAGCQDLLAERLQALGFTIERMPAGGVENLWATLPGTGAHLLLAGHTDVVPSGPTDAWDSDPFEAVQRDGRLYGRGAADMKTSLAAMLVAVETILARHPHPLPGTLSFLITSDEEGDAIHGTAYAVELLAARSIKPDFCIVGEPSSSERVGDVVRCGRRGSLNGKLTVQGTQGHVAYPDLAVNPIHQVLGALQTLTDIQWDEGNEYYPPSSFQISNFNSGTGATNVIPGTSEILFNFRFSTEQTAERLQQRVETILETAGFDYQLDWALSGNPFLTRSGALTDAVSSAIQSVQGFAPEMSTSGGTSDGRFISPWLVPGSNQVEVVELGPTNATIHKVNEHIALAEIEPLTRIYERTISGLLGL